MVITLNDNPSDITLTIAQESTVVQYTGMSDKGLKTCYSSVLGHFNRFELKGNKLELFPVEKVSYNFENISA